MLTGPEIARLLSGEWRGQSGLCPCPICQPERRRDQRALSVSLSGGRLLFKCHKSSCNYVDIVRAAGVETERPAARDAATSKRDVDEAGRRRKIAARAAVRAAEVVNAAQPMAGHPYMVRKGFARQPVPCLTLRQLTKIIHKPKIFDTLSQDDNIICIGLYGSGDLKLQSLQMISPDGIKCFLYGGATKGAASVLDMQILGARYCQPDPEQSVRIVCEGYVTGMSILYAAHHERVPNVSVYCAMTAGNMGETARLAHCDGAIADNDASGTGRRAALATKLPFVMAKDTGTDFNDLWRSNPLSARQIVTRLYAEAQRRKEKP